MNPDPDSPPPLPEPLVIVRDLVRDFESVRAVDGLSFEIRRGAVVGFIGANGAGKTTTMRILTTLDLPTSGTAEVCGYDVVEHPNEVRRATGWMPDHFGTYENMTVWEYLDFYARAFGYSPAVRRERLEEVMEFTDLTPLADRSMNQLSKGMGQRLCLGRTLIHDPEFLVLDEPAAGLDPKARIEFKNLVRILARRGKTIFISSHILSELGEMCDTLLFIDAGRSVHHGATRELIEKHAPGGAVVEVRFSGPEAAVRAWAEYRPGIEVLELNPGAARLRFEASGPEPLAAELRRLVEAGVPVHGFWRTERRLEDAFVDMLRGGTAS